MANDATLYADIAPEYPRLVPVAQSAGMDRLQLFRPPMLSGKVRALDVRANPALLGTQFIQRPAFAAADAATRQDRTSVTAVESTSQDQTYALDPVLNVKYGPKAWTKMNAGMDPKSWQLEFANAAGYSIASYLQMAYCYAAQAVAQLDATHYLDRSGNAITFEDILDAKTAMGDSSDRLTMIVLSSAQYGRLAKYITLGPADAPAIAPLLNPTAQQFQNTGKIELLAGMVVIVYDGVYKDANNNYYAILLATDIKGQPGSGIQYLGTPPADGFIQDGGGLLNPGLSYVPDNRNQSLILTGLAETLGSVWFDMARFAVGTPNPTLANLADKAKWTFAGADAREIPVVAVSSEGAQN